MPDPISLPAHDTGKVAIVSTAGSVATALAGGVTSIVFSQAWVLMGALASKTTVAWLVICVPVDRPVFGSIENVTDAWPSIPFTSGGRNPTVGSDGGRPVVGSIDVKVNFSTPVSVFKLP